MRHKRSDSDQEHVPAVLSRREECEAGAVAAAIVPFFGAANSIAQATEAYGSADKVRDLRRNG
jgi:hypothetical protein